MSQDMRCKKCNGKLAEVSIVQGTVTIMCNRNIGKGQGSCKTLNSFTVRTQNLSDNLSQNPKNAI